MKTQTALEILVLAVTTRERADGIDSPQRIALGDNVRDPVHCTGPAGVGESELRSKHTATAIVLHAPAYHSESKNNRTMNVVSLATLWMSISPMKNPVLLAESLFTVQCFPMRKLHSIFDSRGWSGMPLASVYSIYTNHEFDPHCIQHPLSP